MTDFLTEEIRADLEEARRRSLKKAARLRVQAGEDSYRVLRFWDAGLSLDADEVAHLRGLVQIYDGARHLYQSLIVASEISGRELICTIKRSTAVHDRPPLDYVRDEDAPIAYLPRP